MESDTIITADSEYTHCQSKFIAALSLCGVAGECCHQVGAELALKSSGQN
jgi:hypothetical protein